MVAEVLRCPVDGAPLRQDAEGAWSCGTCGSEFVAGEPAAALEPQGNDDWLEVYVETLEDAKRLRKPGASGSRRRSGRFTGRKRAYGGRPLIIPWDEEESTTRKRGKQRRVAA